MGNCLVSSSPQWSRRYQRKQTSQQWTTWDLWPPPLHLELQEKLVLTQLLGQFASRPSRSPEDTEALGLQSNIWTLRTSDRGSWLPNSLNWENQHPPYNGFWTSSWTDHRWWKWEIRSLESWQLAWKHCRGVVSVQRASHCISPIGNNIIIKYADNTTVLGLTRRWEWCTRSPSTARTMIFFST